jgi:hypothetical protein
MACAHTSYLTSSSKFNGSSIFENREKNEKEFATSSLYMLHIILVFIGNILAKFGSGDVELLGLIVGVCCALGVDCGAVVFTGVLCIVICVTVLGVEGTVH